MAVVLGLSASLEAILPSKALIWAGINSWSVVARVRQHKAKFQLDGFSMNQHCNPNSILAVTGNWQERAWSVVVHDIHDL